LSPRNDDGRIEPANVVFGIIFLIGLVLIAISITTILSAQQTTTWPTIEGVVVGNSIESSTIRGVTAYSPRIDYQYQVRGDWYNCSKISASISDRLTYEDAQSYLNKYPVNSSVTVYYNSDNPSDAVLETQTNSSAYDMITPGIIACVFGLVMIIMWNKRREEER
jgi:hypothetical protein